MALSSDDIWGTIPPEEKLQVLAKSHSAGAVSVTIFIIVCSTLAVGFHFPYLLWGSFLASPLVFQFAAGREWRVQKPKVMLEYLAARSVARRFAYAAKAQDLGFHLLFRGKLLPATKGDDQGVVDAVRAIENAAAESEKWIALLSSAIVGFSEGIAGARLEFVSLINDKITVETKLPPGADSDYTNDKEIILTMNAGTPKEAKIKIISQYPAALIVFEKKLIALQAQWKIAHEELQARELEYDEFRS